MLYMQVPDWTTGLLITYLENWVSGLSKNFNLITTKIIGLDYQEKISGTSLKIIY